MAGPSDQDKLSEDWKIEEALAAARAPTTPGEEAASAQWAAMLDADPAKEDPEADKILNQEEIDRLLAAGGDAFLRKPFDLDTLMRKIAELLEV